VSPSVQIKEKNELVLTKGDELAPVEVTELLKDFFEKRKSEVPPWIEVTKKLLIVPPKIPEVIEVKKDE
jgi:hypothetical protein